MAIRKQDENGNYREIDPATGMFYDDEYPLGSQLGQVEHQTVATSTGRVVDTYEVRADIVDENGNAIINEDEAKIIEFVKEAVSIENLVETFNDNSHETLLKLLALQDNKHPLKKGGIGIAYRTDALIMHCKMEFTSDENIVFDAILGTMSSFPENKTYKIEPSTFAKYSRHEDPKYIYKIFKKGAVKLKERHLIFADLGPNGDDEIEIPWFSILRHHKGNRGEEAYIEFAPTDFFKDLALCSRIVHGAYGQLEVITQLQGKYTIALYWYLENRKRYKEYPAATPGMFDISVEELKHQFSIPESYPKAEIDRRVLSPARNSINSVAECDFTFEYEARYESNKHVGYRFKIQEKNYIDTTAKIVDVIEEKETDPLEEQLKLFFNASKIQFTDEEISRIFQCAKRNDKDAVYMMQIIPEFKRRLDDTSKEIINDKVGYICWMIEQGGSAKKQTSTDQAKNRNSFNNFQERQYNKDDWSRLMEAKLN
ncbi:replication initiation protein [Pseudobutyrivibrio sp.]|uniref:replication initiation protein n=1 Tax=Pseudobutyrivibrio sp. TaxID=2014367 RepID=UPI001E0D5430|nr:replication initiation protein [Pseudobutyrivibrio sp.]MBE5911986.1 replication initiation protein [Pseudobutyrivibrio sp.]